MTEKTIPIEQGTAISPQHLCSAFVHGCDSVLKVGCSDVQDLPLVLKGVARLYAVDVNPSTIEALAQCPEWGQQCSFHTLDITDECLTQSFDAAYSLDTIDKIPSSLEHRFVGNICRALKPKGFLILGTENVPLAGFAEARAAKGRMNPKNGQTLEQLLQPYFDKVSLFTWGAKGIEPGYQENGFYTLAIAEKLAPQSSWLSRAVF